MKNIFNSEAYGDVVLALSAQSGLPPIRGQWFFVDPFAGSDTTGDGQTIIGAFASVSAAYAACTDGAGDGVVILSYVASGSTSANTTSYLTQSLTWAKSSITVVGVNAGGTIFNRSRIASKDVVTGPVSTISQQAHSITRTSGSFLTDGWVVGMKGYTADSGSNNGSTFTITVATDLVLTISETFNVQAAGSVGSCTMTSYCPQLVSVTGANNRFRNVEFWNGGSQAGAIGGVTVSGIRNHFENVHITGGAGCTATSTVHSLQLATGARENVFDNCIFGTDTVDRGNNASGELYLNASTADGRAIFNNCLFTSYTSTGTAHGAIKSASATAMGRNVLLTNCIFENYTPNLGADQTSMFVGTGLNTAKIILNGGVLCGYALADSSTTNKCVFVGIGSPTANGAGGVATTKSS